MSFFANGLIFWGRGCPLRLTVSGMERESGEAASHPFGFMFLFFLPNALEFLPNAPESFVGRAFTLFSLLPQSAHSLSPFPLAW